MKKIFLFIVLNIVSTAAADVVAADTDVFKVRRQALMESLDGRVAVLYGAESHGGGVVEELFVQESSFYYLTGVSEPGAAYHEPSPISKQRWRRHRNRRRPATTQ